MVRTRPTGGGDGDTNNDEKKRAAGQNRSAPTGEDDSGGSTSTPSQTRTDTRSAPSGGNDRSLVEDAQRMLAGFRDWQADARQAEDEAIRSVRRRLGIKTSRGPSGYRGIDFDGPLGRFQDRAKRGVVDISLTDDEKPGAAAYLLPAATNPGGFGAGAASLLGISLVGGGDRILRSWNDAPEGWSPEQTDWYRGDSEISVPADGSVRTRGELPVPTEGGASGDLRIPENPSRSRSEIAVPDTVQETDPLRINLVQQMQRSAREQRQLDRAKERGDERTVQRIRERQKRRERREILRGPDDAFIGREIDEGDPGSVQEAEPEEESDPVTEPVERQPPTEQPEQTEEQPTRDYDPQEETEPAEEFEPGEMQEPAGEFEPAEFGAEPGSDGGSGDDVVVGDMVERDREATKRFDEQDDAVEAGDPSIAEFTPGELEPGDQEFQLELDEADATGSDLDLDVDTLLDEVSTDLEDVGQDVGDLLDEGDATIGRTVQDTVLADPQIQIPELVFPELTTNVTTPDTGEPTVPDLVTDYPTPPEVRYPNPPGYGGPSPPEPPTFQLPDVEFPDENPRLRRLELLFSKGFENPVASYEEIVSDSDVDVPDPSKEVEDALARADRALEKMFE